MLPKHHILLGLIFSGILFYFFPQIGIAGFIIILLSTILIDTDHYLYYIYKKKKYSLAKAYKWFSESKKKMRALSRKQRNEFYTGFCFLHGIEVLAILFVLGKFISVYFYYVLIGFAFHIILDIIHQKTLHDRWDKFSLIYDYYKFKKLKFIDELEGLAGIYL